MLLYGLLFSIMLLYGLLFSINAALWFIIQY